MLKVLLPVLAITFTAAFASASQTSVKTFITCEQDDGDLWYSVALVPSLAPSKYNVLVVRNNEDDGSKALLNDSAAVIHNRGGQVSIFNKSGDMKLTMTSFTHGASGELIVLNDGPGTQVRTPVICYLDSEISYDSNSGPEPRISVGN